VADALEAGTIVLVAVNVAVLEYVAVAVLEGETVVDAGAVAVGVPAGSSEK
jgi:hypothetical protein